MAAYFDLREGIYKSGNTTEDELWSVISYALSGRVSRAASYKFGFLKALLDNLYNADKKLALNFDIIFGTFAEIYWNLVLKYNLRQSPINRDGKIASIERILYEAKQGYSLPDGIVYESLPDSIKLEINNKVKRYCKKNVVGAFFGDTKELFYSFSLKAEWLELNPDVYRFLCRYKKVIEKLNYYEWARYLEGINRDQTADHLLTKIDETTARSNLSYYRRILEEEFETHTCFYCGRELKDNKTHVDHFIPWSFIKTDNLWNFVLSCDRCNITKSDSLAESSYLYSLVERNENLINLTSGFQNYSSEKLISVYDWAKANGYSSIWVPK